jgi:translation initiation factor 2 subunit 2
MDYSELLKKAKKELPEEMASHERFELPKVRGHIQGSRTVVSNFSQIASTLNREEDHLLKYILKELATPGEFKNSVLIIGRKVSAAMINEKVEKYVREFVLCKECKKPDTKLVREEKVLFLKCLACGAKQPVQAKI